MALEKDTRAQLINWMTETLLENDRDGCFSKYTREEKDVFKRRFDWLINNLPQERIEEWIIYWSDKPANCQIKAETLVNKYVKLYEEAVKKVSKTYCEFCSREQQCLYGNWPIIRDGKYTRESKKGYWCGKCVNDYVSWLKFKLKNE